MPKKLIDKDLLQFFIAISLVVGLTTAWMLDRLFYTLDQRAAEAVEARDRDDVKGYVVESIGHLHARVEKS